VEVIVETNTKYSTTVLSRGTRFFGAMMVAALIMPAVAFSQPYTNPDPVVLGTAGTFRILAGSAVTINAGCTVTGDVGLSPTSGTGITGSGSVNGIKYSVDGAGVNTVANPDLVNGAKSALNAAYIDIAARSANDATLGTELGGKNLGRGIYSSGTFGITGNLTLTGTASDIFIFQSGATLITGASSSVILNGVLASNVFWQVTSSATIDGDFKGYILALTDITQTAGSIDGRLLARNGAVTVGGTSVLPVELVSFTATVHHMNAELYWSTATEINNYGFAVERKTMNNEQLTTNDWNKVGFVRGAGSSNSPRDYSYTDNNLFPGRYAYRMKQIDNDGTFSYHGSVEVEIGLAPEEFVLFQNYPNPFNPSTRIQYSLEKASQVSLKVYNILGVEVATLVNGRQEAGSYTVPFNINDGTPGLSSGVYISRLEAGSFVSTRKLILMK
jgi:hypothetical protein